MAFYFVEKKGTGRPWLEQVFYSVPMGGEVSHCRLSDKLSGDIVVSCYKGNLLTIMVKLLRIRTGQPLTDTITLDDKKAAFQYMVENSHEYYYDRLYTRTQEKMFLSETISYTRSLEDVKRELNTLPFYSFNDLLDQDIEFYQVRCLTSCFRIEYTTLFRTYNPFNHSGVEVQIKIHESMLTPPHEEFSEGGKYHDAFTAYSVYNEEDYNPNNEWEDVSVSAIERAKQHSLQCDYNFSAVDIANVNQYINNVYDDNDDWNWDDE